MTTFVPLIGKSRKPMHLRAKPGPKRDPSKARPRWLSLILASGNTGSRARSGQAAAIASAAIADIRNSPNATRLSDCWRLWRPDVDMLDIDRKEQVLAALFKRRAEVAAARTKYLGSGAAGACNSGAGQ
jgi:hypothetical protein